MNRRTLFLIVGAAAVGLLWGGDQLYRNLYEEPQTRLESQLEKLTKDLKKARSAEIDGKAKRKELEFLVDYSLPYDPELARSAYQDWLLALVKSHGMENAAVDASPPRTITVPGRLRDERRTVARQITFGLRAKTDLTEVTAFLYDFYQAGHLHKITSLSVNPLAGGSAIDLTLSIETLSLDACEREGELSAEHWDRLAEDDLDVYMNVARRNVFARGVSKSLAQVTLSGVTVDRQGVPEAWFVLGDNRPTEIVKAGSDLSVDQVPISVVEIETERVLLRFNGQAVWLEIGQKLGEKLGPSESNVATRQ